MFRQSDAMPPSDDLKTKFIADNCQEGWSHWLLESAKYVLVCDCTGPFLTQQLLPFGLFLLCASWWLSRITGQMISCIHHDISIVFHTVNFMSSIWRISRHFYCACWSYVEWLMRESIPFMTRIYAWLRHFSSNVILLVVMFISIVQGGNCSE